MMTNDGAPSSAPGDEAAIYSQLLRLFSLESVSYVVVRDRLEAIQVPSSVLTEMPELPAPLLERFLALHQGPLAEASVLRSLVNPGEEQPVLVLTGDSPSQGWARAEDWARHYEAWPNAQGLSTFSRVAFDEEQQQALVSVRTQRHVKDLSEVLLFFTRTEDSWKLQARHSVRVDNGALGTGPRPWQGSPSGPGRYRPRLFLAAQPPEDVLDELLVYQAFLHSLMGERVHRLVLRGTTVAPPKPLLFWTPSCLESWRAPLQRITREQRPGALSPSTFLASNGLIRIVEQEKLEQLFAPEQPHAMARFLERYPGHALLAFSRVAFDEPRSEAVLYVEMWQPGGWRFGIAVKLLRLEGGWWVESKHHLWTAPEDTLVEASLLPGLSETSAVVLTALRAVAGQRPLLVAYDELEAAPALSPQEASCFEELPRSLLRMESASTPARLSEGLPAVEGLQVLDEQGARSLFSPDDQRGWLRFAHACQGATSLILLSQPRVDTVNGHALLRLRSLNGWDDEGATWLHLTRSEGHWSVRQGLRLEEWSGPGVLEAWGPLASPWKRLHDDFAAAAARPHRSREERESLRVYSVVLAMLLRTRAPRLFVQPVTRGGMEADVRPPKRTEAATLQAFQLANAQEVELGTLLPDTPALAPLTRFEEEAFARQDEANAQEEEDRAWEGRLLWGRSSRSLQVTLSRVGFNATFSQALVYCRVADPRFERFNRAQPDGYLLTQAEGSWQVAKIAHAHRGCLITHGDEDDED